MTAPPDTCAARRLRSCENGAALLEYALLAGAIGLALSSVIGAIGGEIQGTLESFTALLRASLP